MPAACATHGMSPMVSHAVKLGLAEAVSYPQLKVFAAGVLFARTEGIVPAPEPAHAIAAVIDEAVKCREEGRKKVILSTSPATACSTSPPMTPTSRAG